MKLLALVALLAMPARAAKNYAPTQESTAGLEPAAARKTLREFFEGCMKERAYGCVVDHKTKQDHYVASWGIGSEGLRIEAARGSEGVTHEKRSLLVRWDDPGPLEVLKRRGGFVARYTQVVLKGANLRLVYGAYELDQMDAAGRRIADALYVLARDYAAHELSDEAFAAIAERYRAEKPAFPEEARRFRVQAEAAVSEKLFGEAADKYEAALRAAPWWPEGRFNRALVLGELERHGEAIKEMKRYLALAPEAANARAAQDKIYAWEAAAERAAATPE